MTINIDSSKQSSAQLQLQPTPRRASFASPDPWGRALKELQLHALEARAPGSDQLLDFDYGRLERQLNAFLRPRSS